MTEEEPRQQQRIGGLDLGAQRRDDGVAARRSHIEEQIGRRGAERSDREQA